MSKKLLLIFGIAVLLALSQDMVSAQTFPDETAVAEWRQAEGLLFQGQGPAAYQAFSVLLAKFPDHNALLLGQARSAVLSGRLKEAAGIYQNLLAKFPDDAILTDENRQVQALLTGRGPRGGPQEKTTFNLRVRAGIIYDSNANQGSEDGVSLPFPFDTFTIPGTEKISSGGAYLGAQFRINHRLTDSGPWSFVGDAGLYVRGNENSQLKELKASEWQWARVGVGVRYVAGNNLIEAKVKGEVFDYEFSNHVTAVGPEITYIHAYRPDFHLITQFSLDWRDYQRSPSRDGTYGQVGQYGRLFFGESAHSATLGLGYLWGSADLKQLGFQGLTIPFSLNLRLHEMWELTPHISYTWENYKGRATVLDNEDRQDRKLRLGFDVLFKIRENWGLELNYNYTHNQSNSFFYDYAQHLLGLGVVWSY